MAKYKAFIFDLNGTMINDMAFHEKAWFDILNNEMDAGLSQAEVKKQMYGKNEEMLRRVFAHRYSEEELAAYALKKENIYQENFKPYLNLIEGLPALLKKAQAHGIKMAIGTAASSFNLNFVMDNLNLHELIDATVSADEVTTSKPNPEVFLRCAEKLGIAPGDCLVFEDAPKGVEAAENAGMDAVAVLSYSEQEEFEPYDNLIAQIKDYRDEKMLSLIF